MKKLFLILYLLFVCNNAWGAATDYYVTTAGAAGKDGLAWVSAFGAAEFEVDAEGSAEAGDRYFVEEGTYDFTDEKFECLNDGLVTSHIEIIGVKSGTTNEGAAIVLSDYAFGSARPLFQMAGQAFHVDNYWKIHNIQITTTNAGGLNIDDMGFVINCKVTNTNGGASNAIDFYANSPTIIGCEVSCTNGNALRVNADAHVFANYFHDSVKGVEINNVEVWVIGNVIDTCTTGITTAGANRHVVKENTFYSCTTGITDGGGDTQNSTFINNLFDECTAPATWNAVQPSNHWDYNSWDGDVSANTNVSIGVSGIDSDITLTDPTGSPGDFTLPDSSAAEGVGLQVGSNTGLASDYNVNIGADQTDTQAGGGGGSAGHVLMY